MQIREERSPVDAGHRPFRLVYRQFSIPAGVPEVELLGARGRQYISNPGNAAQDYGSDSMDAKQVKGSAEGAPEHGEGEGRDPQALSDEIVHFSGWMCTVLSPCARNVPWHFRSQNATPSLGSPNSTPTDGRRPQTVLMRYAQLEI